MSGRCQWQLHTGDHRLCWTVSAPQQNLHCAALSPRPAYLDAENQEAGIWVLPRCGVTKCERSLHEPYAFVGSYRMGVLTPLSVLLSWAYDEACIGALPPN